MYTLKYIHIYILILADLALPFTIVNKSITASPITINRTNCKRGKNYDIFEFGASNTYTFIKFNSNILRGVRYQ